MNEQQAASLHSVELDHQALFPIREVARLTGVNPVTLRAWERRYGLIQPTRTDSGHRLYSQADVDAVRSILGWLERGVAVSKVGSILARGQALALAQDSAAAGRADDFACWRMQVREAVQCFDGPSLDRLFDRVFASTTQEQVFNEVFMPVWHALRTAPGGFGHASEWGFLDQFLRGRVLLRLQLARVPRRHCIVLAPLSTALQELELLVAGLLLGSEEVGVVVLPATQPLQELALICQHLTPDAVVLFSNQRPTAELAKRLARLGLGCPLLLAGEAAELAQDNLAGSAVVCLGAQISVMRRRLRQYLAGQLDT